MKLLFLSLLLFSIGYLHGQEINWQQTSRWVLYDKEGLKGFDLSTNQLTALHSAPLNGDSMSHFVSLIKPMVPGQSPVWMGHYIVSCETKKDKLKLFYISLYGGFLYDADKKRYYQVAEQAVQEWLDFFAESESALKSRR